MAEQNKMNFAQMTTRQKVTAGVLVIVVLFIIYQVYALIRGSGSSAPAPIQPPTTPPPAMAAAKGGLPPTTTPAVPGAPRPTPMTPQGNNMPLVAEQLQLNPPTKEQQAMNADLLKKQQQDQELYLQQVNNLQRLKIEREIAETTQAIATAKLATDKAQSEREKIATVPLAPVSSTDYLSKLGEPGKPPIPGAPPIPPNLQQGALPTPTPQEVSYVVISVSMQLGRWSAVLGYQGKLYNVSVGDVLPTDGSVVVSINKDGVQLKRNDVLKKISLVPTV